jgi:hypothetical protein
MKASAMILFILAFIILGVSFYFNFEFQLIALSGGCFFSSLVVDAN